MKSYVSPSDRNFLAWLIFLAGIAFASLGWIVWLWLGGNIKGGPYNPSLDVIRFILWGIGVMFCTLAPLFSAASPWRQFVLCIYGLFAGILAAMYGGLLIVILIGMI
jgi:hypothetical protein